MIIIESDGTPADFTFDIALVAIGYERRCRWVTEQYDVRARVRLGLEFGFLAAASYQDNRDFFEERSCRVINGIDNKAPEAVAEYIRSAARADVVTLFVDISSMSREMIANVVLGIQNVRFTLEVHITVGYAPSKYSKIRGPAPIRLASPIKSTLAGWSSRPEQPLGAVFGLGCEPGLALGALQVLEPAKAWLFSPRGIDPQFDVALKRANQHVEDIFDVTSFEYEITRPTITRGRFEALLNTIHGYFRVITVPFGPKIFAWLAIATVIFTHRGDVGVWAFSSREHASLVDRDAEGPVIWHRLTLRRQQQYAADLDGGTR
jgi:hypothetical protein